MKSKVIVAPFALFDEMFSQIVRVKTELNIINSAVALQTLIELANERLDQIEKEQLNE